MESKRIFLTIFFVFFLFGINFAQDGELPGDANCDGFVNVKDLIIMANYFTGGNPDLFCFENADVNGDGEINVIDFILTSEIYVGYGTVTDIDGNVYQTVIIGNQEWMAENLRVTRDASGNNITRYCYGNNSANCLLYGGLYTWHTVMNGQSSSSSNPSGVQGICPTGWHVPSHDEWTELEQYVCNAMGNDNCDIKFPYNTTTTGERGTNEGNALKSCKQVNSPLIGDCNTSEHPRWNSHSTHYGFDECGFSALPGGFHWSNGSFHLLGSSGLWWSSTEDSSTNAWRRGMRHDGGGVGRSGGNKTRGFSLRCVRDL